MFTCSMFEFVETLVQFCIEVFQDFQLSKRNLIDLNMLLTYLYINFYIGIISSILVTAEDFYWKILYIWNVVIFNHLHINNPTSNLTVLMFLFLSDFQRSLLKFLRQERWPFRVIIYYFSIQRKRSRPWNDLDTFSITKYSLRSSNDTWWNSMSTEIRKLKRDTLWKLKATKHL